jgi:hypothetical protein
LDEIDVEVEGAPGALDLSQATEHAIRTARATNRFFMGFLIVMVSVGGAVVKMTIAVLPT